MKSRFLIYTGSVTCFFAVIALVNYVYYLFGMLFGLYIEWVGTFFLFYGLAAIIFLVPMLIKTIFILSDNKVVPCHPYICRQK